MWHVTPDWSLALIGSASAGNARGAAEHSGRSFPGIMKLLGHSSPHMTMRYLGIALPDLQREYQQARSQPRHLAPQPKQSNSRRADLPGLVEALHATQHILKMFRRTLPEGASR